jgi:predicted metal-dependent hydrolase
MGSADAMSASTLHRIRLCGRTVDYRVVCSRTASKLRVRVGAAGVEVVRPTSRNSQDVSGFLTTNGPWIIDQIDRAEKLSRVRRATRPACGEILFRGQPTRVRVEATSSQAAGNVVRLSDGEIIVSRGVGSRTQVARSLESWLRREARRRIEIHLDAITIRLGMRPERLYVMGQRTKWGGCSSRRNLSFNWRLVLAPDYVLRYLVTHEAVHLAIPDHSAKFWLTVQSLCREAERARQWLVSHSGELATDLRRVCTG